jgi:hypothetical protein
MALNWWTVLIAALALLLFGAAVLRVANSGAWEEELEHVLLAFGGLIALLFSESFAEWTGRYGLTRKQWYQHPDWAIRFGGGVLLLIGAGTILGWL